MSIHRAAGVLLTIAFLLFAVAPGLPAARAQEEPRVALFLGAQTPWSTPAEPVLQVSVRARNVGSEPVGDLSLGVTIGAALRSRNLYEASLEEGPGLPVHASTTVEPGVLEPGAERVFDASVDLSAVGGISSIDSLVYPMRVDLRSADVPVAVVDTPVVFLVRKPESPLLLAWTIEVTAPIALDPEGRLADPSFERAIGPRGSLRARVDALARLVERDAARAVDLVVQPSVLEQLSRMADGYERADGARVRAGEGGARDAEALLEALRLVVRAPDVRLSAMPFAAPSLPALLGSGLARDLEAQWSLGRATVEDLLGVEPAGSVVRPPGGALDDAAVATLAADGVAAIWGDADTVARPEQPNEFAPSPTALLAAGEGSVPVVLPDPGTQALLETLLEDPFRAAQATLGELAVIWREAPVPAEPRGVAVSLPTHLPARFWAPFARRVAEAPFLRPVAADELVRLVPPTEPPGPLLAPSTEAFTDAYVDAIKRERRDVVALRSMLVEESPLPDRLDRALLYAEARQHLFAGELSGRAWFDHVNAVTGAVFSRVVPDSGQAFTLLSSRSAIPLRMGDPGDDPLRVTVQLRSSRFRFPEGASRTITLVRPDQIVTFPVESPATGLGSIQVIVRAPSGRQIRLDTLVVRSTAVNRIALVVTVGAALVLLALWSRRLFRRRT